MKGFNPLYYAIKDYMQKNNLERLQVEGFFSENENLTVSTTENENNHTNIN